MESLAARDLVLIDDDETFCLLVASFAQSRGLAIDWYTRLIEMDSVGQFAQYDAAIIDFELHNMTGIDVAKYFPTLLMETPVVLISADARADPLHHWPGSIKAFVQKSEGIDHILSVAVSAGRRKILANMWTHLHENDFLDISRGTLRLRKYPGPDAAAYATLCDQIAAGALANKIWETYHGLRQMEEFLSIH